MQIRIPGLGLSALVLSLLLMLCSCGAKADVEPNARPYSLEANGRIYVASQSPALAEPPEGFSYVGETELHNGARASYYFSPEFPQICYLQLESTLTNQNEEPHTIYEKLIDKKLYRRRILCRGGEYYISLQTAVFAGEDGDLPEEERKTHPDRLTELPSDFSLIGRADCCGPDQIPVGSLCCNAAQTDVYASPEKPEMLLIPFEWTITPAPGAPAEKHQGYEVFLKYAGPL